MARVKNSSASKANRDAGISRRDFARRAALAAAAVAAAPRELLARPEAEPGSRVRLSPADSGALSPQESPGPQLSAESRAEVEAKIQEIFRRHGSRLSEEQKKDIRRLVTEGQKPLENLRAYALENGDEPATVLKIYADEGSPQPRPLKRFPKE